MTSILLRAAQLADDGTHEVQDGGSAWFPWLIGLGSIGLVAFLAVGALVLFGRDD